MLFQQRVAGAQLSLAISSEARQRRRYDDKTVLEVILGVLVLVGVAVLVLWLIGLPGDDDTEELAGFVTANWDEVKSRIDDG
jgi:hypothetical protein